MLPKNFIQKQLESLRTTFFFISLTFSCSLLFIILTSSSIINPQNLIKFTPIDDDTSIIIVTKWDKPIDDKGNKPPTPNFNLENFKQVKDNIDVKDNSNSNNLDLNLITNLNQVQTVEKPDTVKFEDILMDGLNLKNPPEFVGGEDRKNKYFDRKLIYTQMAQDFQIQGKVEISFIVEKDGSISNVQFANSERLGYGLDEIALKTVKEMPKWIPGKVGNKLVRTKCVIPIIFVLDEAE